MSRSAAKVERLWRRISISPVVEVGDEPDTPDEVNWSTGPKLLKDCSALVLLACAKQRLEVSRRPPA
jgi:hypothetical protein